MPRDLGNTGVMRINDQWATTVRYEVELQNGRAAAINLRFLQGRVEVERATILAGDLEGLLGKTNAAAIEKSIGTARPEETAARGELRAGRLAYYEGYLPTYQRPDPDNLFERVPARVADAPLETSDPTATEENAQLHAQAQEDSADRRRREERRLEAEEARAEDVAAQGEGLESDEPTARSTIPSQAAGSGRQISHMPEHIAAKFLRDGDRYFFEDKSLAFVDYGAKLRAHTENASVVRDLVAIARARGWEEGAVRGTQSFRRAVWHEAFVEGLQVSGYTPSKVELQAALKERERRHGPNELSGTPRVQRHGHAQPPQRETPAPTAPKPSSRKNATTVPGVFTGTLVGHGPAPYKFDKANEESYYVKIAQGSGRVQTFWGVGLPDALKASRTSPVIGERVGLLNVGQKAVAVPVKHVDEYGHEVTEWVATHRNSWVLEKVDWFSDPARVAKDISERFEERARAAEPAHVPAASADSSPPASTQSVDDHEAVREETERASPVTQAQAHQRFADAMVAAGLVSAADRNDVLGRLSSRAAARRQRGEKARPIDAESLDRAIERSVAAARRAREAKGERTSARAQAPAAQAAAEVQVRA